MIYDVEVATVADQQFTTIFTAFIFADSVTECREQAQEILDENHPNINSSYHIYIEEAM
ncbi:hypothetical protein ABER98_21265 [Domibacillus aminovorans]|uniref:hypothetical protein n=1 Tax=Domibacillus aminovorans TaxID=29332 RepID=UPI003D23D9E0